MMRNNKKSTVKSFALLALVMLVSFVLTACGTSDSYDTPSSATNQALTGNNTNVLISATTLKSWMDQGLINNAGFGTDKVVIIDYSTYKFDDTDAQRIPGSCRITTNDLRGTRQEGVAPAASLVPTGAQIDAKIQQFGIDEDTIIVFTANNLSSAINFYAARAYFTFRYWGFPKERLRVLDGGNQAWVDAGYGLTDVAPIPVASTYSVRDLEGLNADLRTSLSEMINIVDSGQNGNSYLSVDARGPANYAGGAAYVEADPVATPPVVGDSGSQTPGYIDVVTANPLKRKVAFEGHMESGQYYLWKDLYNTNGTFKSADEIEPLLQAIGWTPSTSIISYCTSGFSGSPMFFAVDAIVDAPVSLYDGSWSQWGKQCVVETDLFDNATPAVLIPDGIDDVNGCMLPVGYEDWATDTLTLSAPATGPVYNAVGNNLVPAKIEPLSVDPFLDPTYFTPDNPEANQVENEDDAYQQVAPAGSGGGAPPEENDNTVVGGC